ncbi:uncharacterized protein LOC126795433 [Argentina anserina]|uniref:uncharacterized protein LOC126795433 n=1 Tax=Argentina anserina TaxID=57926 RepID=UPI00217691B4|nr:uncharacterized protein LOC126795433 [Potentilla anserina]
MARGVLEVTNHNGRNLSNPEKEASLLIFSFLSSLIVTSAVYETGKICCIVYYKDQQKRTDAIYRDGPNPEWHEQLQLEIDDGIENLRVRVHDGDYVTEEEVGICEYVNDFHSKFLVLTINAVNHALEGQLETGDEAQIEATEYDVWRNDEAYGQIIVALSFRSADE